MADPDDGFTAQILLYDGFDELDAIGPYEALAIAGEILAEADPADSPGADAPSTLTVEYVTLEPRERVVASHGTRIEPDGVLAVPSEGESAASNPDILVIPGGGWTARDPDASAWAEAQRGAIPDALAAIAGTGVRLASVCTGTMLLATAGITDGRRAVTHASALDDLRESGATVVDARVVDDGDVVSAGGITSGIDLGIYLVRDVLGETIADRVATRLEYAPQGTVAGRDESA
ncbi:DJ-1/PfpI family protein [Halopenitus sp. POP-27]|uniref:DJ-1/PfpI family protein n=1 Tax=Halopenitus sp. POP-27 TaxID=2994425 RepID=UPI0024690CE9|nr:DJ-1/PfpI family protein [Halopenitus sp. POP-27]